MTKTSASNKILSLVLSFVIVFGVFGICEFTANAWTTGWSSDKNYFYMFSFDEGAAVNSTLIGNTAYNTGPGGAHKEGNGCFQTNQAGTDQSGGYISLNMFRIPGGNTFNYSEVKDTYFLHFWAYLQGEKPSGSYLQINFTESMDQQDGKNHVAYIGGFADGWHCFYMKLNGCRSYDGAAETISCIRWGVNTQGVNPNPNLNVFVDDMYLVKGYNFTTGNRLGVHGGSVSASGEGGSISGYDITMSSCGSNIHYSQNDGQKTSTSNTGGTHISYGSVSGANVVNHFIPYGANIKLTAKAKTGYAFNNWVSDSGNNPLSFTLTSDYPNYYAVFYPISYRIAFTGTNSTGGSTAPMESVIYNVARNLTPNGFYRKYTYTYNANGGSCGTASNVATYTFKNWSTNPDGTGTTYSNQQSVSKLATVDGQTVNLYSQWNSGSLTLPTPTRNDYQFDGWYDAQTGGNYIGAAGQTVTPTASKTIWAHWTACSANAPTITSKSGSNVTYGYSSATASVTATQGDGTPISGYQWYTCDSNGGNMSAISGATSATYNVPTGKNAGSYYFKCKVTGTRPNGNNASTTTSTITVKVNKANGSVSLSSASGTITYPNSTSFTVTGNTSGGTLSVSSGNSAVATASISGNTVTVTPGTTAGSTTITVTSAGTTNYNAASATYTVTVNNGTLSTPSISNNTHTYDGTAKGATVSQAEGATMMYGTTSGSYTSSSVPTFTNAGTYTVYYQASKAGYTTITGDFTVTVNKASQTAPNVTGNAETVYGKADGTMNNLTTAMEYSTDGSSYTAVSSAGMTFAAGTYYVRLKEDSNHFVSPATTVTIGAGGKITLTVNASPAYMGSVTGSGSNFSYNDEQTITATANPGYRFVRWSDNDTTASRTVTLTQSVTYTAYFEAISYTVTVDENGGQAVSDLSYSTSNEAQTKTLTVPTYTGYSFTGWTVTSQPTAGTVTVDGNTLNIPANTYGAITVQAQWVQDIVTFNVSDAECVMGQNATVDFSITTADSLLGSANFTITYNSNYFTYVSATKGTITEDITYVVNSDTPGTLVVSVLCATGIESTGSILTFTFTSALTAPLQKHNLTTVINEAYIVDGGELTTSLTNQGSITVNTKQTTVTVASSDNDMGTVSGSGTYTYNTQQQISATPNGGYEFVKWNDNDTNATRTITVPAEDITYTAIFNALTYTIEVDANQGTGTKNEQFTTSKTQQTVTLTQPTRTGHTFNGWTILVNTTGGTSTVDGNVLTIPAGAYGEMVIQAQWVLTKYNVTWVLNGGVASGTYTQGLTDYGTAIVAPTVTKNGFTFAAWTPAVDATVPDHDVTYTASYNGVQYVVYIDENGGQTVSDLNYTSSETQAQNVTLTVPTYAQGEYEFTGWSITTQSTGGTATINGNVLSIPALAYGNVTVQAQWNRVKFNLSWNFDGGVATTTYSEAGLYTAGATITAPTLVKKGMSFNGWTPAFTGTMPGSDATYTATWIVAVPDFSVGNGSGKPGDSITVDVNLNTDYSGLGSFKIVITYDSAAFEYSSCTAASELTDEYTLLVNGSIEGTVIIGVLCADGFLDSGKLADVTFVVKSGAAVGDYNLTTVISEAYFADSEDTASTTVSAQGKLTIEQGTYTITYRDINSLVFTGTFRGEYPTQYESGVGVTLSNDVYLLGYTFYGWFVESDCSGTVVNEITTTESGDKIFYAKWVYITEEVGKNDTSEEMAAAKEEYDEQIQQVIDDETLTDEQKQELIDEINEDMHMKLGVLNSAYQLPTSATLESTTFNLRFLSTVDVTEAYGDAGFKVTFTSTKGGKKTIDMKSRYCYEKITTGVSGIPVDVSPDAFDERSNYFITSTMTGIPNSWLDYSITVQAYVRLANTTTYVYGLEKTYTIRELIEASKTV